ncbi:MAG: hypothetical protein HY432_03695 [Candidatus Liptonbacteria bacterium]|nr:hypothetical protein [Candidatus Liptonbacteria bacterium]
MSAKKLVQTSVAVHLRNTKGMVRAQIIAMDFSSGNGAGDSTKRVYGVVAAGRTVVGFQAKSANGGCGPWDIEQLNAAYLEVMAASIKAFASKFREATGREFNGGLHAEVPYTFITAFQGSPQFRRALGGVCNRIATSAVAMAA